MVYLQVIWDNVSIFHGATPSAPLNKLALHVGDIRSHDGMQVRILDPDKLTCRLQLLLLRCMVPNVHTQQSLS